MLQRSQAELDEQRVHRAIFRTEDPAHDDGRDSNRQQLRQVEHGSQEGSRLAAEFLLNNVSQQ